MAWFRAETARRDTLAAAVEADAPRRLALRGRVVTMDAHDTVIEDGVVTIEAGRILDVGAYAPDAPHPTGALIETRGTIFPGLIELHNHPAYNAIPLWNAPERFVNRDGWRRGCELYKRQISRPASLLTHDPGSELARSVVRFVECRAMLGGVTTTQGLSVDYMPSQTKQAYQGLVRNVEMPDDPSWPSVIDQINDFSSIEEANSVYGPLADDRSRPFIMHVSEGTDDAARDAFDRIRKPDGGDLIGSNFVAIHAVALDRARLERLRPGAGMVWSPLSNLLLYGATADIANAKAAGVPIALGSDWGPSGTKNLLGELKIARIVSRQADLFSDRDLARMVTSTPARMIGWDGHLGSIEAGKLADLLVIDAQDGDPYENLVDAKESDVVAVLIDGIPRAGRAGMIDPRTEGVELIRVGRQDIVLDIDRDPLHRLAGLRLLTATATLSDALANLPDLAARFLDQHRLRDGASEAFIHLELDEPLAAALMAGREKIGPGDVDRMRLDPIVEVDDPTFLDRLRQNRNIPVWLRDAL